MADFFMSDLRSAGCPGYPFQPVRDNADMKMEGLKMPAYVRFMFLVGHPLLILQYSWGDLISETAFSY
jgi:hypothetical protein